MLHRPSASTSTSALSAQALLPRRLPPRAVAAAAAAPSSPGAAPVPTSTPPDRAESSRAKEEPGIPKARDRRKPTSTMRAARTLVARALATPAPRRGASSSINSSKNKSGIEAAAVATTTTTTPTPSPSSPSPSSSSGSAPAADADSVADIVLGIDPDTRGAMAVLLRRSSFASPSSSSSSSANADVDDDGSDGAKKSSSSSSSSSSSTSTTTTTTNNHNLFSISAVHDTPTIDVPLGRGTLKRPPKTRRRLDAERVALLVSEVKREAAARGRTIEAVVEQPSPSPLNGKLAWYGSGLAFGVWTGVLAARGVPTSFVRAQEWKRAFGLEGGGKDAARAAAVEALDDDDDGGGGEEENSSSSPSSSTATTATAASFLRRKKDHGRADAMLIALWRAKGGSSWGGVEADNNNANDVDVGEGEEEVEEEEEEESNSSSSGSDDEGKASSSSPSSTAAAAAATPTRRSSSTPKTTVPSFGASTPNLRGGRNRSRRGFSSLARCRALPAPGGREDGREGTIDFAAYTFIVDDVVFAREEGEGEGQGQGGGGDAAPTTAMGLVGGSGPQTLYGYAMADAVLRKLLRVSSSSPSAVEENASSSSSSSPSPPPPLPPPLSLALVAGINRSDLPARAREWLSDADGGYGVSRGVSWMDSQGGGGAPPTPRAWQLVEADGTRTQVWRKSFFVRGGDGETAADALLPALPLSRSSPSPFPSPSRIEVPRRVLAGARAHHFGVDPLSASHLLWLEGLRRETTATATMKATTKATKAPPRITSETFQECHRRPTAVELSRLLRPLDLFSPNEAEAASMVGGDVEPAVAAKRLLLAAGDDRGSGGGDGISFLDAVVVRCGGAGATLVCRNRNRSRSRSRNRGGGGERPFSAFRVPAVSQGLRLRDTTGCGNAFLGALAAAAAFPLFSSPSSSSSSSFPSLKNNDDENSVLSRDPALALGVASAAAAAVAEVVGTPRLHPEEFSFSSGVVELAAERALAVRAACEEVDDF